MNEQAWILNVGRIGTLAMISICLWSMSVRADTPGESVYKAKCAGCHGPDGVGSTPAGKAMKVRDFHSPEVQKETDAELTDIISNGKNKMPKYADKLKDSEIKDLVGYVRALGTKK
jgi:mono/diheme cytochrome c family protein